MIAKASASTGDHNHIQGHNTPAGEDMNWARLCEDGYVVLDLLGESEVRDLIDGWSQVRKSYDPVWDVTGMAVTVRHPVVDHLAHDLIRPVVEPRVQEVLPQMVGFMSTYLVKKANSGTLPAHIDWRLVGEPESLTYGCWIPLQDMTSESGALGVVPLSHNHVDFDRTPLSPGHDRVEGIMAVSAPPQTLLLNAGQAVVFDHRLIHFSDANCGTEDRLAVNLGLSSEADRVLAHDVLIKYMKQGLDGVLVSSQLAPL